MTVPDLIVRQGDTKPYLTWTLLDTAGNPVNLTGVTSVTFTMKDQATRMRIVTGSAVTINALNGQVAYHWGTTDLSVAGYFYGEFTVTFADASVETFPSNGQLINIQVSPVL